MMAETPIRPPDIDRPLDFRPLMGGVGTCRLRAWWHEAGFPPVTAVVTDVPDNRGPSVTNGAEAVGSALELLFHLPWERFDQVEHYEANLVRPHVLSLVTFTGRDSFRRPATPSWLPLPGRLDWLHLAVVG